MRYGHPQQAQIIGCIPIGVGPVAASFAGEALTPSHADAAAARARLARVVRRYDLDGDTGNLGLVFDKRPQLEETPARVVSSNSSRNVRPTANAGQVFEADTRTHLNRILDDALTDGVVFCRLETSLPARQPLQDRATTASRRPCALRSFLLERTPNSMMTIADDLAQIARPFTIVRCVQNINAAHIAADPIGRDNGIGAFDLDLNIEKEHRLSTGALHRELGRSDAALARMPSKLLSLVISKRERDASPSADNRQAGRLAIETENAFVVLHGPIAIVIDCSGGRFCSLSIGGNTGDCSDCEIGGKAEAFANDLVALRLKIVLAGHGIGRFPRHVSASLRECFDRSRQFGANLVGAVKFASDGQNLHRTAPLIERAW